VCVRMWAGVWAGMVETPGLLAAGFLMDVVGRKTSFVGMSLIAGPPPPPPNSSCSTSHSTSHTADLLEHVTRALA
jgi:hypothetical protein